MIGADRLSFNFISGSIFVFLLSMLARTDTSSAISKSRFCSSFFALSIVIVFIVFPDDFNFLNEKLSNA